MTKKEFIEAYAIKGRFGSKADAERKAKAFLETLEDALVKGEEVAFMGFGSFKVVGRSERTCRNPQTGEAMKIEAKKVVKFKAGKLLAEKVK